MRSAATAVLFALFLLAPSLVVQAQQVRLSDGTYASPAAYLEGTWKFERPEPRQTMIMRFSRDGTFFFHNLTTDLQHWGSYRISEGQVTATVNRSCESQGRNCSNQNPLKFVEQPFEVTSANVFMSNSERWDRMK